MILALVGFMFFSPLSTQFTDDSVSRGSSWEMDIDEFINANQTDRALNLVDSLIEVKSQDLPRFSYFDRFLSEDERLDVANARADVYELQWKRIEILKATNQIYALRDALEDYVDVIGYNQEAAEDLLKQINSKQYEDSKISTALADGHCSYTWSYTWFYFL